ncbi:hypothetical protein AB833_11245 [Chromatiales bacterium (ex Bugula neritina AB1)]|nr:hypothetical protein AB833_11245 [Chromatiales bacterium (ex Bugula neritina AB1)]
MGVALAFGLFATGVAESQDVAKDGLSFYPPDAKPGECYAKVLVPAKYDVVSEKVLKREASDKISITPAKFQWVEERILVKEASERLKVKPATFRWVEERIMVEPGTTRLVPVPAVFETVSERVLDRPEQTSWKKGRGPVERIDNTTGEILCLVVEPATYKTINRTVVKKPASTRQVDIPPVFKTIRKQVLDKPAEILKEVSPAEYSTIRVRKMIEPPRESRVSLPAEFQTVTKRVRVSSERMSWQPILCETNVTQEVIAKLQQALATKGFSPGDIDGVLGSATLNAVEAFQRANSLARGGITMETLKALNVTLH